LASKEGMGCDMKLQSHHSILIYSVYNARRILWKENVMKWMDYETKYSIEA
jgi:hypothetical protein